MNEVVQLVQQKTGLSQDMAETVVNTVVGYIKGKLPAGLASGLDQLMAGSGTGESSAASAEGGFSEAKSMMSGLEGMLGGKES
jgi:hypothetical protein